MCSSDLGQGKPAFHQAIREKYGTDRVSPEQWAEVVRVYYGMVSRVDDQLGRIMQSLDQSGQLDNTLVVFLTDHGEYLGDFGLVEKWPSAMDRSIVHNPVIFAGAGVAENAEASTFAEMLDILPTLLELADIKPAHTHFGRSLVPCLGDSSHQVRDRAFSEGGFALSELSLMEQPTGGYYRNKQELQHEQPEVVGKVISMRTRDYTYVYRLYEEDELYDRKADPEETINLLSAQEHSQTVEALRGDMLQWLLASADTIPWKADPRLPKVPNGQHELFTG